MRCLGDLRAAQHLYGAVCLFRAEILDCEALGVGLEKKDVDTDRILLYFEKRNLLCFHGIIYSGHVECGFVFNIVAHAMLVDFRFLQGRQHGPQKTFRISVLYIYDAVFRSEECGRRNVSGTV